MISGEKERKKRAKVNNPFPKFLLSYCQGELLDHFHIDWSKRLASRNHFLSLFLSLIHSLSILDSSIKDSFFERKMHEILGSDFCKMRKNWKEEIEEGRKCHRTYNLNQRSLQRERFGLDWTLGLFPQKKKMITKSSVWQICLTRIRMKEVSWNLHGWPDLSIRVYFPEKDKVPPR